MSLVFGNRVRRFLHHPVPPTSSHASHTGVVGVCGACGQTMGVYGRRGQMVTPEMKTKQILVQEQGVDGRGQCVDGWIQVDGRDKMMVQKHGVDGRGQVNGWGQRLDVQGQGMNEWGQGVNGKGQEVDGRGQGVDGKSQQGVDGRGQVDVWGQLMVQDTSGSVVGVGSKMSVGEALPGLSLIISTSTNPFRRVMWAALLLITVTLCAMQCVRAMSRYIEGSTTIDVKRNLLVTNIQRPAITLCNNNRLHEVWMQQYGACQTLVTDGRMDQLNPNFPAITLTLTENFTHTCPHHVCFNASHHMGWTLIIHPPTEPPFQLASTIDSQLMVEVRGGQDVNVMLSEEEIRFLPAGHHVTSDCCTTYPLNSSQVKCAEECLADMMVKKWGDGACQLLWMSPQPGLPLCTTLHQTLTFSSDYYWSILQAPASDNRRRLEGCRCLAECVLKRYSMEMLDRLPALPSTQGIVKAQLKIYLFKERNIQEKKWSYPVEALLADLGGYLGFTIGASCLTLYHILESALIALVRRLAQTVRGCRRPG
ncbi:hypothetical protein Pcinc_030251 [Petrolisthes cinctipes]|uniref:Uncharacterized protein n=1 Tax=Petrolisthes cinctipes TaxID=88211 RepID=A0AAE1EZ82_PETCI|nr:hypothetical protein Pcinc_030251 [Petrolisthes cinctipes]